MNTYSDRRQNITYILGACEESSYLRIILAIRVFLTLQFWMTKLFTTQHCLKLCVSTDICMCIYLCPFTLWCEYSSCSLWGYTCGCTYYSFTTGTRSHTLLVERTCYTGWYAQDARSKKQSNKNDVYSKKIEVFQPRTCTFSWRKRKERATNSICKLNPKD